MDINLKKIKKILNWPAGTLSYYNPWYTILWRAICWPFIMITGLLLCLFIGIATLSVYEATNMWNNIT